MPHLFGPCVNWESHYIQKNIPFHMEHRFLRDCKESKRQCHAKDITGKLASQVSCAKHQFLLPETELYFANLFWKFCYTWCDLWRQHYWRMIDVNKRFRSKLCSVGLQWQIESGLNNGSFSITQYTLTITWFCCRSRTLRLIWFWCHHVSFGCRDYNTE